MAFKGDITYPEVGHIENSISIPVYSNVFYFQCSYNVWYYTAYLKICLAVNCLVLSLKFQPKFSFLLFLFLTQFDDYSNISPWENISTLPKNLEIILQELRCC